ncbi:MAG: helix-turn-helix domain-containing protein [Rhodococcus sp. (in: high G+C Gram-positive bacteria)]
MSIAEFSTAGLPFPERLELWEGHNADVLIGLRCRRLESAQLEASERNVQLESVQLARVIGTSHVVERDAELIRRRPSDSVMMYFSLVGDAFFYSEDGVRTVGPGQVLLCDADKAFMRGFSHGLEELVVKMPHSVFGDVSGLTSLRSPMVFDFSANGNVHAAALAQQVGHATRSADPTAPDERAILELVSVLATGARADLSSAHRASARAFIERRLFDTSLSATAVASAVGISARQLSRVFAADGTSVPKYILQRRLDLAHARLTTPSAAASTIAEIAHDCGFTSAAYFSNAFATKFGARASDVRRDAVIARSAG